MRRLSKLERATAKATKGLMREEMSKLNLLSLALPNSTTSGPLGSSSMMKFLIDGRYTRPRKFSMYPPISLIHTGCLLCSSRILSLFSGAS